MKKKIVLAVIAAALVLAAAIGTTFASFNTESENPGEATITLNDMQVALAAAPGDDNTETIPEAAMPGQEVNLKEYVVQNALEAQAYDIYTRVIIDKQWDGAFKDELDAGKVRLYIGDNELNASKVGQVINDWFIQTADDEQIILYYTKKLAPGAYTDSSFINKISFDADMDNSYTDKTINVNITVCAVQATADSKISTQAMFAEWGAYPVIDEETGIITNIEE
ncbi:MAG: hypothetical protein J5537_06685 [Lachnospiraceae bacterium]|nr:hypothetical protein [Lachnospiraceae bacterium]